MKDIREYKKNLRQRYRDYRTRLQPQDKSRLDEDILSRVTRLNQYADAKLLLVYVSTAIEVDTRRRSEVALADGKRVAVPRCVPDTRLMEFYEIDGLDQLSPGTFGVLEPNPETATLLTDSTGGLCIVPALCYDEYGYRLGYGKGYYDRFLSNFNGITVGICYAACVRGSLIHGRYDRPVELLVTERYIKRTLQPTEKARIKNNWGRKRNG